jgi:hypothetical protein
MMPMLKRFRAWLIFQISQAIPRLPRPAGLQREVVVGDITIIAFEITVAEMRRWLVDTQKAVVFDLIGATLFKQHEVTVNDLVLMSTATRPLIESCTASELVKLVEAVKEANPFFFQFRQGLTTLAIGNR